MDSTGLRVGPDFWFRGCGRRCGAPGSDAEGEPEVPPDLL